MKLFGMRIHSNMVRDVCVYPASQKGASKICESSVSVNGCFLLCIALFVVYTSVYTSALLLQENRRINENRKSYRKHIA